MMARCILVSQMIRQGYSVTTASKLSGRTTQTIRRILVSNDRFLHSSRAYRIAIEGYGTNAVTSPNHQTVPSAYQ